MKYTISFILILCFVFTLFTACGQTPETPTDVNSPETQQTAGGEGSSVDLQQEVQEKTQEEHQSQNEQSAPVQTASKEIGMKESAVSNNKENNDNQLQGDEPWSPPAGFTSVEGFRSWLQTGGIEEEKRAELLNNITNSTTYSDTSYCSPKLANGNQDFVLKEIEVYPYTVIYWYGFAKNTDAIALKITTYIDPVYMADGARSMKERYDLINNPEERIFDEYGSANVNNITYYYYYYPTNNSVVIDWQINNNTFRALYYGDYAQINEILPLLELEQVEYKVADNTVIK